MRSIPHFSPSRGMPRDDARLKAVGESRQVDRIQIARDRNIPLELLLDGSLQGLRRGRLAVREVRPLWGRGKTGEPTQQFALPRMRRKLSQFDDFGVYGNFLTEELQSLCAFLQGAAARALRLKSRQDHGVT